MKASYVLSLALLFACSPARTLNQAQVASSAQAASTESLAHLEEKTVEAIFSSQDSIAAEPVNIEAPPAPTPEPDMTEKVREVFANAQSSQGQKLSPEQVDTLTTGFMNVVNVAQSRKPAKTAEAWNQLVASIVDMNRAAKAEDASGLIGDILDLALDIVDLAGALIVAVLKLDVAGVLDVALDLIDLLIDFLV